MKTLGVNIPKQFVNESINTGAWFQMKEKKKSGIHLDLLQQLHFEKSVEKKHMR